jgi:hypothetical protein
LALTSDRACRFAAGMVVLGVYTMPATAATPEEGRRAYDAGHFTDAMGIWSALSRQGNAEAEFGLGLLYDLGNGTPEDPETAFFWYKAAADAGLPAAEFNIAAMYDSGRGVAQSTENAALWYAKAAAHEHHRAQFDLGLLYERGEGVPRNPDAAAAWFRKSAEGGLPAAAARLKALTTAASNQTPPNQTPPNQTPPDHARPDHTRPDHTRPDHTHPDHTPSNQTPWGRPSGPMAAVTLASPARNAVVTLTGDGPTVELVWVGPAEPQPTHYEVQVRELGGPTLRTVFAASVSETATFVHLPANSDFYVWNVNTVGRDGTSAPGDWNWFTVGPPASSEQSIASAPGASNPHH